MGGDKGHIHVMPMLEGLKRGYAVVAINYRMSGEAKFPALVQDAKAAIRWIRANAPRYGIDPHRIAAKHLQGHCTPAPVLAGQLVERPGNSEGAGRRRRFPVRVAGRLDRDYLHRPS